MDVSADESIAAIILTVKKLFLWAALVSMVRFGLSKLIFTINLKIRGLWTSRLLYLGKIDWLKKKPPCHPLIGHVEARKTTPAFATGSSLLLSNPAVVK